MSNSTDRGATGPGVELIQFAYSPYNEKARWALDFKGIPHRRISLLPGPHTAKVRKLTGQTQTPVLVLGNEVLWGSAQILAKLDEWRPDPALLPADPGARREALDIQSRFDDEWTPRMRRAILNAILDRPAYLSRMFACDASPAVRLFYRAILPLAKGLIRRGNGITGPDAIEDGIRATEEALDFVARKAAGSGFLVGDRFGVADLTAAAALAAAANPDHPDMKRPEPMPGSVRAWLDRWRDHPGAIWVRDIYASHRPVHNDSPSV